MTGSDPVMLQIFCSTRGQTVEINGKQKLVIIIIIIIMGLQPFRYALADFFCIS
jgi:hypothetical protein